MDLNRQSMPAPKFTHTPRGKNQNQGTNSNDFALNLEDSSSMQRLTTEHSMNHDGKKQQGAQNKQTSKSVELAELSQFQSVLKRHDPSSTQKGILGPGNAGTTGGVHRIPNARQQGSETTQSLPDSLSELKLRHHESTKLVPSSGGNGGLLGINSSASGGVSNAVGFQLGGTNGMRSDTPISGVNNTAAVRLPSLQKQPQNSSNKYSRYSGSSLPNAALRN